VSTAGRLDDPPGWHGRPIEELPWAVVIRVAVCWGVVCMILTLLAAAFLPRPFGFIGTTVVSGSMMPNIQPGDVALVQPLDEYGLGQVILFPSSSDPDVQIMHRIVEIQPDGMLVTKGDANRVRDSAPVDPETVIGVGRILVPAIGLPIVWAVNGEFLLVVLTVLLTALLVRGTLRIEFFPSTRKRDGVRAIIESTAVVAMLGVAAFVIVVGVARSATADFVDRTSTEGSWAMTTATPPQPTPSPTAPLPSGVLTFNYVQFNWKYGEGGIVGLQASTSVRRSEGTGIVPKIALVVTIDNSDGHYLVGAMPVVDPISVQWTADGPSEASGDDIVYRFTWTGALPQYASTANLLAIVPLSAPLPQPPTGTSPWSAVASADGMTSATDSGGSLDIVEEVRVP